ncbi:MAG: hypothetical protein ACXW07_09170, partial [Nitrososphaeraceae archaeon]
MFNTLNDDNEIFYFNVTRRQLPNLKLSKFPVIRKALLQQPFLGFDVNFKYLLYHMKQFELKFNFKNLLFQDSLEDEENHFFYLNKKNDYYSNLSLKNYNYNYTNSL